MTYILIFCLLGYIIGSVPSAVWVGKTFFGVDVREHGSGNAGATNVFRVLGKTAGSTVLLLDVLKGLFAARLSYLYANNIDSSLTYTEILDFKIIFGVMAIVGHLFPVFANFRGGKGVATLFGVIITLNPGLALWAVLVFLLVFVPTGYVSLGSMIAGISIPVLAMRVFSMYQTGMVIFTITLAVLVVLTHKKNIQRLIAGTENRMKIFGKGDRKNKLA